MKARNTLILLVLAAGLFAFIHFYESKLPSTREAKERETHVVQLERDDIDGITITNNDEQIELRKRDNEWFIEEPVKDRADSGAVTMLLSELETLRKESVVTPEEGKKLDLKDYGLANPKLKLKLSGKDAPPEIFIGKDTAVEGKIYLRLENSETAFVVSNQLKTQIAKKPDDFRDRRLTDLSAAQVQKLVVKNPAGEIELEKKGDHWQLNRPVSARADDSKTGDLISQIITTRIDTFVPGGNIASAGLDEPRGTLTLYAEGEEKPVVLEIGREAEKQKDKVFARLSSRDSIYLLPKKIEEPLNLKPADLRDKKLLRLGMDGVDRVTIEPAGKPKVVLARKEESWTINNDKPANAAEIDRVTRELLNADVAAFVADTAGELPKYGLDKPRLKVTFSAYASENTAESQAGENPIVTVMFGNEHDGKVYAALDTEPFVVSVNRSVMDAIPLEATQWQDVSIYTTKPDEIVSLEISKAGQAAVALKRDGKKWTSLKADARVNETNVQSLLNTLASLRAVRWAGPGDVPVDERQEMLITFTTKDNATHKLTITAPTADNMWLSTAEGYEGKFLLSSPDVEALRLPVIDTAVNAPAPTAQEETPAQTPASSPAPVDEEMDAEETP